MVSFRSVCFQYMYKVSHYVQRLWPSGSRNMLQNFDDITRSCCSMYSLVVCCYL